MERTIKHIRGPILGGQAARPTNRGGPRKPEGRYLGLFSHLSAGQTLLASKELNPRSVER